MACRFDPCQPHHVGASYILLAPIFVCKNQSVAIYSCSSFFAKGHIRVAYSVASALINAFGSLPTFCGCACGAHIYMVRHYHVGMELKKFLTNVADHAILITVATSVITLNKNLMTHRGHFICQMQNTQLPIRNTVL